MSAHHCSPQAGSCFYCRSLYTAESGKLFVELVGKIFYLSSLLCQITYKVFFPASTSTPLYRRDSHLENIPPSVSSRCASVPPPTPRLFGERCIHHRIHPACCWFLHRSHLLILRSLLLHKLSRLYFFFFFFATRPLRSHPWNRPFSCLPCELQQWQQLSWASTVRSPLWGLLRCASLSAGQRRLESSTFPRLIHHWIKGNVVEQIGCTAVRGAELTHMLESSQKLTQVMRCSNSAPSFFERLICWALKFFLCGKISFLLNCNELLKVDWNWPLKPFFSVLTTVVAFLLQRNQYYCKEQLWFACVLIELCECINRNRKNLVLWDPNLRNMEVQKILQFRRLLLWYCSV